MKKWMFLAVASMFAFASCSDEEDPVAQPQLENGSVVFQLSAVNQLTDGLSSRALVSDPIYSQEAIQNVSKVTIYAFLRSGSDYLFSKSYDVTGWTAGNSEIRYVVPESDMLPIGDYRFLVVGRDASDNYTVAAPTAGTTSYSAMVATIAAPGEETEIFAGATDAAISSEGVRVNVEMTRVVAGVLGYFKNVPQQLNGSTVQYLRLNISKSNTQVGLFSGIGSAETSTAYDIINIDLSEQTVTDAGVFSGNTVPNTVAKVPNSQLSGSYYLPVGSVKITLGLYDADNNLIKEWPIINESGDKTFDIVANNFYSLGVKKAAATTDGGTSSVSSDDDKPIDLLLDQNITISINPGWATIHSLELGEND